MNNKIYGTYNYMPYGEFMGEKIESENTRNIITNLYTEQEYVREISIYNYNGRFYDNSIGRFYSKDIENEFPSPYIYAGNNSISFTDPSGNSVFGGILSTVLGIGAIALGIILAPETFGMSMNLTTFGGVVLSGALIGAGISSGLYGATHMNDSFNWTDWGVESAIGAGIGIAANGAFMTSIKLIDSIPTSYLAEGLGLTLSQTIIGGGVGFIGNGLTNTYYGEDFTTKGHIAAGIGAGIGLIAGAGVVSKRAIMRSRMEKFRMGSDVKIQTNKLSDFEFIKKPLIDETTSNKLYIPKQPKYTKGGIISYMIRDYLQNK